MNSVIEKEKKLNLALTKLKNLNLKNPDIKKNIENLSLQKNQLEIEKQELEDKYKSLIDDYNNLRKKLDVPHKLSELIDEKDFDLDRLSKMALADPSTGGNPKKLTENDMKIMYQHSMTGELFK